MIQNMSTQVLGRRRRAKPRVDREGGNAHYRSLAFVAKLAGISQGSIRMRRFIVPIIIVVVILVGLAFLTEGSAIAPFLYRNF
jgi:Family of unknown function (DUF5989)